MILSSKLLSRFSEVVHGFTTRKTYPFSTDSLVTLKQIHSNKVFVVQKKEALLEAGDALITDQPGVKVAVRTADCAPLLIYDPTNRVVAAVHTGWRGLISGVIEETLKIFQNNFDSHFANLEVAIGPALCPGCFEIGPEVTEQFKKKFGDRLTISPGQGDRSFVDLRKGCCVVLEEAGVPAPSIDVLPHCTACEPELFYSYRRGDRDARMLAFIGLR